MKKESGRNFLRLLIIVLCGLSAMVLRNLGVLNILSGAISVIFLVGLFPAVIGARILNWDRRTLLGIVGVCAVAGVLGLVVRDNYAGVLERNCLWRL